jgi:peptidoglycan/LPS O-acetylase OafA/YrhL
MPAKQATLTMEVSSAGNSAGAAKVLDDPTAVRSGAPRLIYLDVLRAAAILLVLGAHTIAFRLPEGSFGFRLFRLWRHMGWVGVDLFFVLSGFLIGGLLFAEYRKYHGIHFGRFLIRRSFKIWPGYLALLAAVAVWDIKYVGSTPREAASDVWPYLLQIQNYFGPLVEEIGQTWSLAVEEHFYLLLPLLLAILIGFTMRRGARTADRASDAAPFRSIPLFCLGLSILCLALRTLAWRRLPHFEGMEDIGGFKMHWPTHLRLDSLFVGVTLAYFTQFSQARVDALRPWKSVILLLSLACFIPPGIFSYYSPFTCTIGYTLLAIGSAGLVLLAWFRGTDPDKIVANAAPMGIRLIAGIGAYSYSIYLWHMPFVEPFVTKKVLPHLHLWGSPFLFLAQSMAYVAVAIALGVFTFYAIEKPALRVRDRLFPSRSRAAPQRKQDQDPGEARDSATPTATAKIM